MDFGLVCHGTEINDGWYSGEGREDDCLVTERVGREGRDTDGERVRPVFVEHVGVASQAGLFVFQWV